MIPIAPKKHEVAKASTERGSDIADTKSKLGQAYAFMERNAGLARGFESAPFAAFTARIRGQETAATQPEGKTTPAVLVAARPAMPGNRVTAVPPRAPGGPVR